MKSVASYNLDVEVKEWLKQEAEKENRSVSWILNELIKKAMVSK